MCRDPPEPTGDEPEDFEYEAPKIYEHVRTHPSMQYTAFQYIHN